MAYCSNCGVQLQVEEKFCHACGYQVKGKEGSRSSLDERVEPSTDLYKGETKQSKKKKVIEVPFAPIKEMEKEILETPRKRKTDTVEDAESTNSKKGILRWVLLYLSLNLILPIVAPSSDELLGSAIYAIIVALVLFIRRNKEKPVHWSLKIIIGLQTLLFIGLCGILFTEIGLSLAIVLLVSLIGINIKFLFH